MNFLHSVATRRLGFSRLAAAHALLSARDMRLLLISLAVVLGVGCSDHVSSQPQRIVARTDQAFAEAATSLNRAFERWAASGGAAVTEGLELASARRPFMRQLLLSDPKLALSLAMSTEARARLAPEVRQHVEVWRAGVGDFEVIATDGLASDGSQDRIERFVRLGGERFRAGVFGRREAQGTRPNVRLQGVALDGVIALTDVPKEEADEPPASSRTIGPKRVLVIRVDFSDVPGDPVSATAAANLFAAVSQLYQTASYGQTSMPAAVVTATYRLPKTAAEYQPGNHAQVLYDARVLATAAGYVMADYDYDVVLNAGLGGYAGMAFVGGKGAWINAPYPTIVAHELGHNYGVSHANFLYARPRIIGAGSVGEYGNPFDMMAVQNSDDWNAYFKWVYNWLTPASVPLVTTSGTYRIFSLEKAITSGASALRVQRSASPPQQYYWLEFRESYPSNAMLSNGLSINLDNGLTSLLLDMTPDDIATNSPLVIGRTYSDALAGIHVTPIAKPGTTPPSIDVVINLGTFEGNASPTLSLTTSSNTAAVGAPVTLTATASDPDGDPLAYGWEFDDGTFGANLAAQSKSFSADGVYSIRCTVSDMKGHVVTRSVTVTVGAPTLATLSGTVTAGGQPLEGVRISGGGRATFTSSDGTWSLTNVPSGAQLLTAEKFDFTFTAGFGNPVEASSSVTGLGFTAVANGPYSASGSVWGNGAGVPGVTVRFGQAGSATTNASGDFVVTGLPNARYEPTATKPGWRFVAQAPTVDVFGSNLSNVAFSAAGATLLGSLVDDGGIVVAPTVTDGERTTTARPGGGGVGGNDGDKPGWSYILSGVPEGSWNLVAQAPGFTLTPSGFSNPVTLGPGDNQVLRDLDFQVVIGTTYTVSGTVRTGGVGLPGATLSDGSRTATTDSLGRYVLVAVPAGTFSVTVTRPGDTFSPPSRAVSVTTSNLGGIDFDSVNVNAAPLIASATAAPPTVQGLGTTLSATATDDAGEAALVYTWARISGPPVSFCAAQGTNAAKTCAATFLAAGDSVLQVTVVDAGGLSTSRTVAVNVVALPTSATASPAVLNVAPGSVSTVTATLRDQFGGSLFATDWQWFLSGQGTFAPFGAYGTYTAPATAGGPYTLTATARGQSISVVINVLTATAPFIVTGAAATPSPVTGKATALTVSADDDGGEAALVYQWAATGPAPVVFSINGTHAAKSATATFALAGTYSVTVNVTDAQANSVASQVSVSVVATASAITISPATASLPVGGSRQFTGAVTDQFGTVIAGAPITWSATGGTVDALGSYQAGQAPGAFTVTATSGSLTSAAMVTVVDAVPPVVAVTVPAANAMLSGHFSLTAEASDNVAVSKVEFFVGATKVGQVLVAPFTISLDAENLPTGPQSLTAKATDSAGNWAVSTAVQVVVWHAIDAGVDDRPPLVSVVSPSDGDERGLTFTLEATAIDNVAVLKVEFELDGVIVATDLSEPWLHTVSSTEGTHHLVAIATDTAGNSARSSTITFMVRTAGDGGTQPPADAGAGTTADAGSLDAGRADAGAPSASDAGPSNVDADAGPGQNAPALGPIVVQPCGCSETGGANIGMAVLCALLISRRRFSRPSATASRIT